MSGFVFGEMFGMLEHLATLLATVLVSRHGALLHFGEPEAPTGRFTPATSGATIIIKLTPLATRAQRVDSWMLLMYTTSEIAIAVA